MIQHYSQVSDWLPDSSRNWLDWAEWSKKRKQNGGGGEAKLGRRAVSAVGTAHGGEQKSFLWGKSVLGTRHRRRADKKVLPNKAMCHSTEMKIILQLLISITWTLISAWMLWIYMSSFAGPLRVDRHCWLRLVSDSVLVEHSHFAHNVHNHIVCIDNNTVVAMILLSVEINILVLWSDQ